MEITETQCGNCGNSLSRFFGKIFVKVTVLLKKLLTSWFHENFFSEREFPQFPHCVFTAINYGEYRFHEIFSSNSKILDFSIWITRKAKAASGRLSFERGYNQTCLSYRVFKDQLWFLNSRLQILTSLVHQNQDVDFDPDTGDNHLMLLGHQNCK